MKYNYLLQLAKFSGEGVSLKIWIVIIQFSTHKDKVRVILPRDKTVADKLMYFPNDDIQNYTFCRLQIVIKMFGHSTEWTNKSNSIKSPKVVNPTSKKTLLWNFGD